jgi:putative transposase
MGLPGAYGATAASKMKKLGHKRREVHNRQGVEGRGFPPSPERPTSWRTFLKAHAGVIAATDFFTVDVWTVRGLVTHYVLFVIHHASRLVEIAGVTTSPDAAFMAQVARNLTDPGEGFLRDKRCLILDRDTKFTAQFRHILEEAGVRVVNTAVQAPNMNSICEHFVQSIKRECLEQLILFGADHLQHALNKFVA